MEIINDYFKVIIRNGVNLMQMHLNHQPFTAMQNGTKQIEVRLNDEKRSQLRVGDLVSFTDLQTGEILETKVLALEEFPTFKDLFRKYSGSIVGSSESESIENLDRENMEIYSRAQEAKYGALAIRIVNEKTNI